MNVAGILVGIVVGVAFAVFLRYPRQTVSHLTHWKAGPRRGHTFVVHQSPRAHLAVAGDVGHAGARLDATGAAIAAIGEQQRFDALVLLGDHAYPRGDPSGLPRTVFGPFGAVLEQGTQLLAVLGNHDVLDGHGPAQLDALGMEGRWWQREFADLVVVGLDSNDLSDEDQRAFLDHALATTRARWKIVALHHPPYSAGYQGSHVPTRETFVPIFERHGVDVVLSAHDHDYQRSRPIGGVTYIVTGGAARARFTGTRDFTAASFRVLHFVDVVSLADRLVVRGVDHRGRVFDELVVTASSTASMRAPTHPGS